MNIGFTQTIQANYLKDQKGLIFLITWSTKNYKENLGIVMETNKTIVTVGLMEFSEERGFYPIPGIIHINTTSSDTEMRLFIKGN